MEKSSAAEISFLASCAVLSRVVAFLVGLAALAATCQTAAANSYVPTGIYDVDHVVLENGLKVILKPRGATRSVSMRLAVDVGHWDFPCGRQETAHFLEHLLFTGTTDHEESELDTLIESHGGRWNATTSSEETVYEIDINSRHADIALDTLHEIMAKSEISGVDVLNSRDIVHREMGGNPSATRRWLYRLGFGKGAWSRAWELLGAGTNAGCTDLESAERIYRDDILAAYGTYYVPGNMMLVVVGDFEPRQMLGRIQETFGQLPPGAAPQRAKPDVMAPDMRVVVNSHFSPVLDGDAFVGLVFRVPGQSSLDQYALRVLEAYLHKRVFDELRVERGLAYAPAAETVFLRRFGLITTHADVYVEDMDTAIDLMEGEVRRILEGRLEESEVEEIKRGLLLSEARKYERNSDIAEHYVEARFSLTPDGEYANEAELLSRVTAEDIHRIALEYLHVDRGVVLRIAPTLTYTELVMYGGAILLSTLILGIWRRSQRKKPKVTRKVSRVTSRYSGRVRRVGPIIDPHPRR